jgi:hypothetical protein
MRASPPIEVRLHRFGAWHVAIATLGLVMVVAIARWMVTVWGQAMPAVLALAAAATIGGFVSLAACASVRSGTLQWDGVKWQWTCSRAASGAPVAGVLQIRIDLGFWMLLRFVADFPVGLGRVTWLPVQQRAIAGDWHALRCAVHGPTQGGEGHERG